MCVSICQNPLRCTVKICACYYKWAIPQQRNKTNKKEKKTITLSCNLSSIRLAKTQIFNKPLCKAMGKHAFSLVASGNTKWCISPKKREIEDV